MKNLAYYKYSELRCRKLAADADEPEQLIMYAKAAAYAKKKTEQIESRIFQCN